MSAGATYAGALFEAAREKDELEGVLEDLQEFVQALRENEELRLFFYGGQIPERQKRAAVEGLTEDMRGTTTNFLKVLVDNGREELVVDITRNFEDLVKEHQGRVEVEVTTAVELSDEALNRIKYRLGRMLEGREVILKNSVDSNLLGGAVFRFGGQMMDGSVRGRLESLREGMFERSAV